MRIRYYSLAFLFILLENSFSQIKIVNTILQNADSSVLYVGIDNRLQLYGLDSSKQYYVSSAFAKFNESSFIKYNVFNLRVNGTKYIDTLILYNSKKQIIHTQSFRVDFIENPVAMLDSISPGFISKNQLLKVQQLRSPIPNCMIRNQFEVLSFDVKFECKKCDEFPVLQNTGPFLSASFFKMIPLLTFGDKVIFCEIKLKCNSGLSRKIPSIIYTIK